MSSLDQWHYTDKTGKQCGPITQAALMELISNKSISSTSMVWKDGMPGWKPLSQMKELQVESVPQAPKLQAPPATPTSSSPQATSPTSLAKSTPTGIPSPTPATFTPARNELTPESVDPYVTPNVPSDEEFYAAMPITEYGGIGRTGYILYSIVVAVMVQVLIEYFGGKQIDNNTSNIITASSFFATMLLSFSRLKNIGMSRWWFLGNFVPILNMFVAIWTVSRQKGWVESETLDAPGKVIAWILWSLIILSFLAILVILAMVLSNT